MVAETRLAASDLVMPFFITTGRHQRRDIPSMPGIYQQSADNLLIEADRCLKLGIKSVMLFGLPEEKDPQATSAFDEKGVVQEATRLLKQNFGTDLVVMTDTCLCEYTTHGHCGLVMDSGIVNDPTLDVLSQTAVSQAAAGADVVCPSDMMDGRVQSIRWALDDAGFTQTVIMAYSAKYASAMYAPFRDAAASTPAFGDRRTYQMDPKNRREALLEVEQDVLEGADIIMLKPALGYLDIVREVRDLIAQPIAVYNVSGEYAMVKAAVAQGWLDESKIVPELLTGMKRAGADLIVTYHAMEAVAWI